MTALIALAAAPGANGKAPIPSVAKNLAGER